ncbi:hypothetical protein GQ53DRAFT_745851 [Thozetella sp. PMI_491]|nr:hypothetical protein GQ53DRAFT_745851 [Thozetella sp. PMI_491]
MARTAAEAINSREMGASSPSSCASPSVSATPSSALSLAEVTHDMYPLHLIPRSLDPQMIMGNSLLRQPGALRLFHHYLDRTNRALAICQDTKNPYLAELVPMAMSSQLILNGILACSGIHYSVLSGLPADESTWFHYGQAVQGAKYGLTKLMDGQTSMLVPLLTTAIILCMAENFRENSGVLALQHLTAARSLLQEVLKLPVSQLSRETRAFLIERYTYSMILAHVTMGPEADSWVLDDAAALFPLLQETAVNSSAMLGCVHELFQLIPSVSILARRRQAELQSQSTGACETDAMFFGLYSTIQSWQPTSDDHVNNLCGRFYQQALLVYLASSLEGGMLEDGADGSCYSPPVQAAFDEFIPLLASIMPGASISTTLGWPLAIFGSCARTPEHRSIISDKLNMLSDAYSAKSVRETKTVLEKLWARDEPSMANPMSLEYIMKSENMTVLFL